MAAPGTPNSQLGNETVQSVIYMELMPHFDGLRETMRHRRTQGFGLFRKSWLSLALMFGAGWLVGKFLPETSGQDSEINSTGNVTNVSDFAHGHWAMFLYPRTSLTRQASIEENTSGDFAESTSNSCAISGCNVNWTCRGDFDEREASAIDYPIIYSFYGIEIDNDATGYSMRCDGVSDFDIFPLVPRQASEPNSSESFDEALRLYQENLIRDLRRRANENE